MPGVSGVLVVTNARVFFYTRGCGCVGHPAFPTPSWAEGPCKTRALRAAGFKRMSAEVVLNRDKGATYSASSLRKQGPITTGLSCCAKAVEQRLSQHASRRMAMSALRSRRGPGFRGDDIVFYLCCKPALFFFSKNSTPVRPSAPAPPAASRRSGVRGRGTRSALPRDPPARNPATSFP